MKKHFIILSVAVALTFSSCGNNAGGNKSIAQKVDSLMSLMTLQEKIGQLNQRDFGWGAEDVPELIRQGGVGSLLNCAPERVNEVQRIAVEESRLGIPLLIARDVVHGYKTIFPIPLAQACSWDTSVVKAGAQVAAAEAAVSGIKYTFAPMIDVTHEPRWGRIAESLGEDALLTSRLGVAMVQGFQGDDMADADRVAACAKHFAAYGLVESGRDYNSVFVSEERLRDWVLPPFKAVADAGVATFMAGFNELNGVPVSGSKFLLRDVLRGEWNYPGMVISDYFSIDQLWVQGYSDSKAQAAADGINAGVDMDMMGGGYYAYLDSLVAAGEVSEAVIDEACRRVLTLKYQLGLFDNPYTDMSGRDTVLYNPAHLQMAREAAAKSVVLVKNTDKTLPIKPDVRKIAVIGPMADAAYDQMGTWCFDAEKEHSVTPLAALREEYGDKIIYAPGTKYSRDNSKEGFAKAVAAARQSDIVLLFLGEEAILSGEAKCRADISLPGAQTALLEAVEATGKPVVTIVMSGRPNTLPVELSKSDAMLIAMHGGTMAGPAIADILSARTVPQGKLPVTFPSMVGQVPIYYNDYRTGRPADYRPTMIDEIPLEAKQTSMGFCTYWLDAGISPLLPFGYGLSYTTFEYSDPVLSSDTLAMDGQITVTCDIKNTGDYDGTEIVQLYTRDHFGSLVRPVKELKDFQLVDIKAGEDTTVTFTITPDMLEFCNADMRMVAEPGDFTVWVAPNSAVGAGKGFYLGE